MYSYVKQPNVAIPFSKEASSCQYSSPRNIYSSHHKLKVLIVRLVMKAIFLIIQRHFHKPANPRLLRRVKLRI